MFNNGQGVFISHSAVNAEITKQLTSLLRNIGISNEQFFCSSIPGQGVNNSEKINDAIYEHLRQAGIIIYLLSDNFLQSAYCMQELGAGWYRSYENSVACYYLRVPDFEMDELSGFVNSKINKFSLVNDFDDVIVFIENVVELLELPSQKTSVITNYAKTFISAIKHDCEDAIMAKRERIDEVSNLKEQIKNAEEMLESYRHKIEIIEAEKHNNDLKIEFSTIDKFFRIAGMGGGIDRAIVLKMKQFWFKMVNRYKELKDILNITTYDGYMEKLLTSLYISCDNYAKAYEHFLNAINVEEYISKRELKQFVDIYPYSLHEPIKIYEEKLNSLPEGLTRDFIIDSLKYMKEVENNKK